MWNKYCLPCQEAVFLWPEFQPKQEHSFPKLYENRPSKATAVAAKPRESKGRVWFLEVKLVDPLRADPG